MTTVPKSEHQYEITLGDARSIISFQDFGLSAQGQDRIQSWGGLPNLWMARLCMIQSDTPADLRNSSS
jgi:hypothetical protein